MNTDYDALPLHNADGDVVGWTLLDTDDADALRDCRLCKLLGNPNTYVAVSGKGFKGALHRIIMGLANGDKRTVDHINGDPMDNRRANLRVCTRSQNAMNKILRDATTGLMGVKSLRGAYRATARMSDGSLAVKTFNNPHAAALWRDAMILEEHGEYGRLNVEERFVDVGSLQGRVFGPSPVRTADKVNIPTTPTGDGITISLFSARLS